MAELTDSGVLLRMAYRAGLTLGGVVAQGSGNLSAVGTPTDPIVITAADSYSEGAWRTITLSYCDAETAFSNFEIAYPTTAFTFIPLNASANQTCMTPSIDAGVIRDARDYAFNAIPEGFEPGELLTYDNLGLGVSP